MNQKTLLAKTALVLCLATLGGLPSSCLPWGPVDTSLLTGQPCGPPCWQGLVPGVSTLGDVSQFIAASGYVGDHYRGTYAGRTIIRWQSRLWGRSSRTWNAFSIRDESLIAIRIHLDYELTLEQLLEEYGHPERFRAYWAGWSSAYALVNLYYPSHGFTAQLEVAPSDGHHDLQPQSRVTRVWYFAPTTLDGLLNLAGVVPFPDDPEDADTVLQDWHGYGPVDLR